MNNGMEKIKLIGFLIIILFVVAGSIISLSALFSAEQETIEAGKELDIDKWTDAFVKLFLIAIPILFVAIILERIFGKKNSGGGAV